MGARRCTVIANVAGGSSHRFSVELADTPFRRARGLMGRQSWQGSDGMLFVYPWSRVTGIWMAGTHLPLDAVFISAIGKVIKIAHDLAPQSRHTEYSGARVKWVLEVPAGTCREIGLEAGNDIEVIRKQARFGWVRWLRDMSGRLLTATVGKRAHEAGSEPAAAEQGKGNTP